MPSNITMYVRKTLQSAADALRLARTIEQQLDQMRNRELLWRF